MSVAKKESAAPPAQAVNEVRMVGRVSGPPESREMPSGDVALAWRLVIERPESSRRVRADGKRGPSSDTIDCIAWSSTTKRSVATWRVGDVVEVRGAIRKRFFRAGVALGSRVEVEADGTRIIRRAAT